MKNNMLKAIVLALFVSLVATRPAFAYIDPSSGGLLFQALAAAFALFSGIALLFSRQIRVAFARIRRFLRRASDHDDQQTEDS